MSQELIEQENVEQPVEQAQTPKQQPVKERRALINTPYIFIAIPLLAGAVWLAGNTWVITNNLNQPYALLAGPAVFGSALLAWIVFKFFTSISKWCQSALQAFSRARKEDGSALFFWIVIFVFMAVSVFASGSFFSMLEKDAVPGLGYATALFIDLVAVQAMKARLNAVRMRDKGGSNLYLAGVLLCSGASAFANVYTSLGDFTGKASGALPPWMVAVAPWFGLVFPALILLLSITADYTIDQISTKLDPEQYKQHEEKRMKLLEIQRDMLSRKVEIEHEIDRLSAKSRIGKERRVFFLVAWFFPVQRVDHSSQIEELREQIQDLGAFVQQQLTQFAQVSQQSYEQLSASIQSVDSQRDDDNRLIFEQINKAQTATLEKVYGRLNTSLDETLNKAIGMTQEALNPISQQVGKLMVMALDKPPVIVPDKVVSSASQTVGYSDTQTDEKEQDSGKSSATNSQSMSIESLPYLNDYPIFLRALSTGAKSLTIEEIIESTGHSRKMVKNRIDDGTLRKTKNPNKFTVTSVIDWLKDAPLPAKKELSKEAGKEQVMGDSKVMDTPRVEEPITDALPVIQEEQIESSNVPDEQPKTKDTVKLSLEDLPEEYRQEASVEERELIEA